jgi:hypothetical protein
MHSYALGLLCSLDQCDPLRTGPVLLVTPAVPSAPSPRTPGANRRMREPMACPGSSSCSTANASGLSLFDLDAWWIRECGKICEPSRGSSQRSEGRSRRVPQRDRSLPSLGAYLGARLELLARVACPALIEPGLRTENQVHHVHALPGAHVCGQCRGTIQQSYVSCAFALGVRHRRAAVGRWRSV